MYANNKNKDSNLRKHLGFVHNKQNVMFLSQKQNFKVSHLNLSVQRVAELDNAVFEAIIIDGRTFSDFKKTGNNN